MLVKTATLQWTLQDISESKFASTVKSTCARNPSLRGSQGMQESSYTTHGTWSNQIQLQVWSLLTWSWRHNSHFYPQSLTEGPGHLLHAWPLTPQPESHLTDHHRPPPAPWGAVCDRGSAGLLPFWQQPSLWSTQNTHRSAHMGQSSTGMGGGPSMETWRSCRCRTTGLWWHTDLHWTLSPSFLSAF